MRRLTIWFLTGLILLAVSSKFDVYASSDGPTESECRPYIEKALNELKTVEVSETEHSIDDSHVEETGKEVEHEAEQITEQEAEQIAEQEVVKREEQMMGDEPITEEKSEDVEQSALPLASDIDDIVSDGELKVDENDLDGDGIPNDEDDDIDGDGIPNTDDNDIDGDGVPNHEDNDIDGDGVPNDEDNDIDGDGIPNSEDDDIDGDGVPNHEDNDIDGDGIPNVEDNDIDGDGIPNNEDDDIDGDGVPNQEDDDIDGDGILNVDDSDMDGDGIANEHDEDMDGDGVVNEHDDDMDGDGIANEDDDDIDGDGLPNHEDDDLDGDGIPNHEDDDIDGDGIPNDQDIDLDGDGIPNPHDHDIDGDGVPNPEDTDIDGDGIENIVDQDIDGDGIPNTEDQDIDGDGLPNEQEPVSLDIDGDGVPNDDDSDIDGDVIPNELDADMDGDGIPNTDDLDIDGDGIPNVHDEDKLEPLPIQPGAIVPPDKEHKDHEKEKELEVTEIEQADEGYIQELQNDEGEQNEDLRLTEEEPAEKVQEVKEDHVAEHLEETAEPATEEISVDEKIKEAEEEILQRSRRSLESASSDMDGDGIPDHEDEDVDGDGIPNHLDDDVDGDGVPNHLDDDIDGDGIPNEKDADRDGDGIPNAEDDNDGEADDKKEADSVKEDAKKQETEKVLEEEDIKPEDELLWEGEIPEVRRSRDHIVELLQLGEDSNARENALESVAKTILRDIKRIYENAIKPLETMYKYRDLSNRHFSDPEIFSKPLVLFMGPWSGGKSTIINYLTDNEYTSYSLRSGAEPSPAYFNILMWGNETEILDGTQLAADYTFSGLQKFGQGLEDRLRGLKMPNKLLEKVNIVEIPGILEVRKQVSRLFPFNDACQWFIDRADIIFLVYDPAKLDVGPETEAILDQLKGREYQTRIILNKADTVKPEELLRVQSALIWNISPLMSSAQPPLIYTTSLWSLPYAEGSPARLLLAQERAFLRDLRTAVEKRIENKIASARRFAVRVRNHAKMVDCYLNTYYNHKTLFSNKKRIADNIIENPQNYHIYEGLSTLTNISRYDLPDPEVYRDFFRLNPLYEFKKLSETCSYFRGCPLQKLDVAIAYDLPDLTGKYKKMAEAALLKAELSGQPKS